MTSGLARLLAALVAGGLLLVTASAANAVNPPAAVLAQLGRAMFFDPSLSVTLTVRAFRQRATGAISATGVERPAEQIYSIEHLQ